MKTKEKTKKETGGTIAATMKDIQSKFGEDAVMMLSQNKVMDVESISTGSFGLDLALGVGGYPKGRVIEISGPESSGKTTLALHAVAEAQKKGGVCAYIDTEHALDPLYAKKIGVANELLLISQPAYGEQALDIVESMVRSGKFALVPKAEIEGEMGDPQVGRHSKLMSHALRKLVPLISESKTVVIFINQIRMNINVMPGASPEFTPGGKALLFYSSIRIDIRRIAQIKKGDEVVGGRTRIKVKKNKVAPPFKQTEFDILYGEGISREGEIIALGNKYGIIEKNGNTYSYNKQKIGTGYDSARHHLQGYPTLANEIVEKIQNVIKEDIIKVDATEAEVAESKEGENI